MNKLYISLLACLSFAPAFAMEAPLNNDAPVVSTYTEADFNKVHALMPKYHPQLLKRWLADEHPKTYPHNKQVRVLKQADNIFGVMSSHRICDESGAIDIFTVKNKSNSFESNLEDVIAPLLEDSMTILKSHINPANNAKIGAIGVRLSNIDDNYIVEKALFLKKRGFQLWKNEPTSDLNQRILTFRASVADLDQRAQTLQAVENYKNNAKA